MMPSPTVYDYYQVIRQRKPLFLASFVFYIAVIMIVIFTVRPRFRSQAVILPIASTQQSSLMSTDQSLGSLTKLLDISGPYGPTEIIVAILKSRQIASRVIQRENLLPILFEKDWDPEKRKWKIEDPIDIPVLEDGVTRLLKWNVKVIHEKQMP